MPDKKTISLKLPTDDDETLSYIASSRGMSKSDVVREALAVYFAFDRDEPAPGSLVDRARDLVGCVEGPEDLSSNQAHLAGFGAPAHRD